MFAGVCKEMRRTCVTVCLFACGSTIQKYRLPDGVTVGRLRDKCSLRLFCVEMWRSLGFVFVL